MDGRMFSFGVVGVLAAVGVLGRRGSRVETAFEYLLLPPGQCPYVGPEKGRWRKDGVVRLDDPHGSVRYLWMVTGAPRAVLQVVKLSDGTARICNVFTVKDHRREGLARKLLRRAERDFGVVEHSDDLSEQGRAWKQATLGSRAIELTTSPLTYRSGGPRERLQLVEQQVPAPARKYAYFQPMTSGSGRSRQETPGADPGVVAFVDFVIQKDGGIVIDYMATRDDLRRRGYARRLVEALYALQPAYVDWGRIVHDAAEKLWRERQRGPVRTYGKLW